MANRPKKSTRAAAATVTCSHCGAQVNTMGMGSHRRSIACRTAQAREKTGEQDDGYEELLQGYMPTVSGARLLVCANI